MSDLHARAAAATKLVQEQIRWRPNSAEWHLGKRKRRGHLTASTSLADYERIIQTVVTTPIASIYAYHDHGAVYVVIVTVVQNRTWLVMFDMNGILESAYIVDRPKHYLSKPAFELLGRLEELSI